MYDALRRKFQCATVQLDFQLPIRFNLTYATEGTEAERPVIVHRAVLGSIERMYAILTEHFAGKWPLWLSPRQVMVVPISEASYEYAHQVSGAARLALSVAGTGQAPTGICFCAACCAWTAEQVTGKRLLCSTL